MTVDEDCATTAAARITALFRAHKVQFVSEGVQKRFVRSSQ